MRMCVDKRLAVACVAAVMLAATRGAYAVNRGDVLASVIVPGVDPFTSGGALLAISDTGAATIAAHPNLIFREPIWDERTSTIVVPRGGKITRLLPDGDVVGTPTNYGLEPSPARLTMNAAGTLYVAGDSGDWILEVAPSGVLERAFDVLSAPHGVDLATDQCTLYYVVSPGVAKINVCAGTPPVVIRPALPSGVPQALRLLPGGDILVADTDAVVRLDPSGHIVRTYSVAATNLALDPTGTSAWVAASGSGVLVHLDLSSGAVLSSRPIDRVTGLATVGEWRAALQSPAAVPALSPPLLGALAAVLALVAWMRLRS